MTPMIRKLSERVHFYTSQKIPDNLGGWASEWTLIGSFWAQIKPMYATHLSRELTHAKRLGLLSISSPLYQITVRKQVPLKANLKVHWRDKMLMIVSEPLLTPNRQGLCACASLMMPDDFKDMTSQGNEK